MILARVRLKNTAVAWEYGGDAMDGSEYAGLKLFAGRLFYRVLDHPLKGRERFTYAGQRQCGSTQCRKKPYRGSSLLYGLIRFLDRYLSRHEYDMGIISGTTRELKLYRHLPLGSGF